MQFTFRNWSTKHVSFSLCVDCSQFPKFGPSNCALWNMGDTFSSYEAAKKQIVTTHDNIELIKSSENVFQYGQYVPHQSTQTLTLLIKLLTMYS